LGESSRLRYQVALTIFVWTCHEESACELGCTRLTLCAAWASARATILVRFAFQESIARAARPELNRLCGSLRRPDEILGAYARTYARRIRLRTYKNTGTYARKYAHTFDLRIHCRTYVRTCVVLGFGARGAQAVEGHVSLDV
jgi:hypothetical protein